MSASTDANAIHDDSAVLRCWHDNACAWTAAVRQQKIQSRTLVTNQAIINAVLACHPASVLDLGCGEGWLSRQLAARGMRVLGVDAIEALITAAQLMNVPDIPAPEFRQLNYRQIAGGELQSCFDLVVCNFSLLDRDGVHSLLHNMPALLHPQGEVLIQTLHPQHLDAARTAVDGWREESWNGIGDNFRGVAPWYYRTLSSWHALFHDAGLRLAETLEPIHPLTGSPASIIFRLSR